MCKINSKHLMLIAAWLTVVWANAQPIDRKALVRRHNPQAHHIGSDSYLLGTGSAAFQVDATALQTFTPQVFNGIRIGLNIADTTQVDSLTMTLDRWAGKADSRFRYKSRHYRVETVCPPTENTTAVSNMFANWPNIMPVIATRITSDSTIEVTVAPETKNTISKLIHLKNHAAVCVTDANGNTRWTALSWRGQASVRKRDNKVVLRCKKGQLEIFASPVNKLPGDAFFNNKQIPPFTEHALRTAQGWNSFWAECGLADFSETPSPAARITEKHMVETLYRLAADTPSDWWLQSPLTIYGFAKQLAPAFARRGQNRRKELWQRPEFIAAAQMVLRAYTHPLIAERFSLNQETVEHLYITILNAYAADVAKAAEHLQSESADHFATSLQWIDRNQLLATAEQWQSAANSLRNDTTTTPLTQHPTPLTYHDNLIFRLPPETREHPEDITDSTLLLLAIAAHWWPSDWNVASENILPLP